MLKFMWCQNPCWVCDDINWLLKLLKIMFAICFNRLRNLSKRLKLYVCFNRLSNLSNRLKLSKCTLGDLTLCFKWLKLRVLCLSIEEIQS